MAQYIRCQNCQTKNEDTNYSCEKCGQPLRPVPPTAAPPPPPVPPSRLVIPGAVGDGVTDNTAAVQAAFAPTQPPAPPLAPTGPDMTALRIILDREVQQYVKSGYRVVSRTDTTAQLIKPKRMSCLLAVILLLLMVLPFLIYLLWYAAQKDEQVYLEVDLNGRINRTKRAG